MLILSCSYLERVLYALWQYSVIYSVSLTVLFICWLPKKILLAAVYAFGLLPKRIERPTHTTAALFNENT
ncbi:hypothetical protein [Bacillus pumilus]|uniref:hypothetical protein n=1 Tax=Bacillus pumilus TaxID=1408 RepID=UPI0015D54C05|nr:hypothetical protein [Bacillus pumilus]QLI79727.1 hypothetical protein HZ310_18830 [Bacillus pumilus]